MTSISKIAGSAVCFLLAFATGFLLSRLGKPYHSLLFTFHKLISVGGLIITFFALRDLLKAVRSGAAVWALIILLMLCVLALLVTGGLMSVGTGPYSLSRSVHTAAPIIGGIILAWLYVFLYAKR
jgi:hypothetical protein